MQKEKELKTGKKQKKNEIVKEEVIIKEESGIA